MIYFINLILLAGLYSCATPAIKKTIPVPIKKKTIKITDKFQNFQISPGEVKFISIDFPADAKKIKLKCNKKSIPFILKENKIKFFIAESYFSRLKPFDCKIAYVNNLNKYIYLVAKIKVIDKKFRKERLRVDKKRVTLSNSNLLRVKKERKELSILYKKTNKNLLVSDSFRLPLNSKITSFYGTKRIFNNKKSSQHLGTDFRAAVGVPIPATNSGKVVFAGELFYSGKCVIIDHGLNIFTLYGHLSELNTIEGEFIKKGSIIGYAGKSGRVSGPHLHWGVKIQGEWVDGQSLISVNL